MLFWLGILSVIVGLVFQFNGTEWFSGENNLPPVLIIVGLGLLALYVVFFLIAAKAAKSAFNRFDRW